MSNGYFLVISDMIETLEMNPMGTEAIVTVYNDFRSQVMLLQELKSALATAEFELESLRNKMDGEGRVSPSPSDIYSQNPYRTWKLSQECVFQQCPRAATMLLC